MTQRRIVLNNIYIDNNLATQEIFIFPITNTRKYIHVHACIHEENKGRNSHMLIQSFGTPLKKQDLLLSREKARLYVVYYLYRKSWIMVF